MRIRPNSLGFTLLLDALAALPPLAIARAQPPLMLPGSALVVNAKGTQVATVTPDQTIRHHPVQIRRDYGTQIEVISGLNTNETILANPTVDLVEGTKVNTVAASNNQ